MEKITLRALRAMVNTGAAVELDEPNHEKIGRLYSKIAYSRGVYGIGALLRDDETGQLYAIIGRSSTLFYFV